MVGSLLLVDAKLDPTRLTPPGTVCAVVSLFIGGKDILQLRTVTETHVRGLGLKSALVVHVGALYAPLLARPVALLSLAVLVGVLLDLVQ